VPPARLAVERAFPISLSITAIDSSFLARPPRRSLWIDAAARWVRVKAQCCPVPFPCFLAAPQGDSSFPDQCALSSKPVAETRLSRVPRLGALFPPLTGGNFPDLRDFWSFSSPKERRLLPPDLLSALHVASGRSSAVMWGRKKKDPFLFSSDVSPPPPRSLFLAHSDAEPRIPSARFARFPAVRVPRTC